MAAINAPRFGLVQFVQPDHNVTLYFRVGIPVPEGIPPEIVPYMSVEVYQARVQAVMKTASHYVRPVFEIIWLLSSLIASIATPIVVYHFVENKHRDQDCNGDLTDDDFNQCWNDYTNARLISFGVFVLINLLTFLPLFIWKSRGRNAVNQIIRTYEQEDRAVRGPGAPIATWTVRMPHAMMRTVRVKLAFPMGSAPTYYQPGAQIPTYLVNPPPNSAQFNGYNYGQGQSVMDQSQPGVQLYDERDEKSMRYIGPEASSQVSVESKGDPFADPRV